MQRPEPLPRDGDPLVVPIVQSTTFCRDGVDSAAVHKYSRESNPTVAALEEALGRLEDAPPAVCYATGLAAETGLFTTLLGSGDHAICSRALYGGTTRLLRRVFARFGVAADFVDTTDLAATRAALRPTTRLVFVETPANPTLEVTDVAAAAALAHQHGALLGVDNTFLTAALQRPLDLGADLSLYSTTKFVEGHSTALGGAIVARDEDLLERLRFVRKCTGNIQTPFNAWLTLQGMKTLPLRMNRQSQSARVVAAWLADHAAVALVRYPGVGAVVSFELKGGVEAARALLRSVRLCRLVEHVGSVETLLTHPATMTHGGVAAEDRAKAGVSDGLVRLSVGLEEPDAIVADLECAIRSSGVAAAAPAERSVPCTASA